VLSIQLCQVAYRRAALCFSAARRSRPLPSPSWATRLVLVLVVVVVVAFTAFSVALGFLIPSRSGIWIAALAWPLAERLRLIHGVTSPGTLLILPAAFCAMSAYAGLLIRRRTATTH
jgi:hypothetical protein